MTESERSIDTAVYQLETARDLLSCAIKIAEQDMAVQNRSAYVTLMIVVEDCIKQAIEAL